MRNCETFNLLKLDLSKNRSEFDNLYYKFCNSNDELNEVRMLSIKKRSF